MSVIKTLTKVAVAVTAVSVEAGCVAFIKERIDENKCEQGGSPSRSPGVYERFIKRPLDCTLATGASIVLSPLLLGLAILVRTKLGSPIIFAQERPGKDGEIFRLYKFRSMTNERDEKGELLPDSERLTKFGSVCRSLSLDETPELLNIIKGDMAVIGPRPQLVRDMVFMTKDQRRRHSVRPGLSGLAQVNGRNVISWEEKFDWDLKYIDSKITFLEDCKLIFQTFQKALSQEGITDGENATASDYGDALLLAGKIDQSTYDRKQKEAKELIAEFNEGRKNK